MKREGERERQWKDRGTREGLEVGERERETETGTKREREDVGRWTYRQNDVGCRWENGGRERKKTSEQM